MITCLTSLLLSGVLLASSGSLFEPSAEDKEIFGSVEDITVEPMALPAYAVNASGDLLVGETFQTQQINEEMHGEDIETVSGSDVTMYAESSAMLANAVALANDVNISVADAYLSSSIVDCFSRVVDGLPSYYKYAAYRANSSDSSEGFLLFSPDAYVDGNFLVFEQGAQIGHYYRVAYQSGYNTYYDYKYDVTTLAADSYRIPYNSGQLVYTNMVAGYPALSEYTDSHYMALVIPVFVIAVAVVVIFRRRR